MTDQRRSLLDRAARLVSPVPIRSFAPPPRLISDGLWVVDRQLGIPPGLTLPTRMTVIRLPDGGLALHSPVDLDSHLASALRSLGTVEAIIAPNSFHYLFAADYVSAFSGARVFVAPGLADRVPSFRGSTVLTGEPPPVWSATVGQVVFGPIRGLAEVVLFHRPSETLVLTDLAFNLRQIAGLYNRLAWRLFGVPPRFGPSRSARLTLLRDRTAAGPYLAKMLDWNFNRIIVAHGDILERDAKAEFRRAFAAYL